MKFIDFKKKTTTSNYTLLYTALNGKGTIVNQTSQGSLDIRVTVTPGSC